MEARLVSQKKTVAPIPYKHEADVSQCRQFTQHGQVATLTGVAEIHIRQRSKNDRCKRRPDRDSSLSAVFENSWCLPSTSQAVQCPRSGVYIGISGGECRGQNGGVDDRREDRDSRVVDGNDERRRIGVATSNESLVCISALGVRQHGSKSATRNITRLERHLKGSALTGRSNQ